jgi:DnaK suppressor protein
MDPERARESLARERERIEQALRAIAVEGTADDLDPADAASDLSEIELDQGLEEDLRDELAAVERAEQRLAAGTYGLSVESGTPIPDARLEADPTAERTVEEQERFERGA